MSHYVFVEGLQKCLEGAKSSRDIVNDVFTFFDFSSDGKVSVPLTAPDTLTTYVTTAFAVSQTYGLGVTRNPSNVWQII